MRASVERSVASTCAPHSAAVMLGGAPARTPARAPGRRPVQRRPRRGPARCCWATARPVRRVLVVRIEVLLVEHLHRPAGVGPSRSVRRARRSSCGWAASGEGAHWARGRRRGWPYSWFPGRRPVSGRSGTTRCRPPGSLDTPDRTRRRSDGRCDPGRAGGGPHVGSVARRPEVGMQDQPYRRLLVAAVGCLVACLAGCTATVQGPNAAEPAPGRRRQQRPSRFVGAGAAAEQVQQRYRRLLHRPVHCCGRRRDPRAGARRRHAQRGLRRRHAGPRAGAGRRRAGRWSGVDVPAGAQRAHRRAVPVPQRPAVRDRHRVAVAVGARVGGGRRDLPGPGPGRPGGARVVRRRRGEPGGRGVHHAPGLHQAGGRGRPVPLPLRHRHRGDAGAGRGCRWCWAGT